MKHFPKSTYVQVDDPTSAYHGQRGAVIIKTHFPDGRTEVLIRMDMPDIIPVHINLPIQSLRDIPETTTTPLN